MFRHVTTRLSGLIILIAGIWGGLIPFLGPTFHFTLGPDHAWTWTTGRLWLSVIPAAVAVLGGLILMGGGPRVSGRFGALIALAAGVWFAVGPDVSMLWNHGVSQAGSPHGQHTITRMLEFLTLHSGIGVLITAFAAYSLPAAAYRRRRAERDAAIAGTGAAVGAAEAHHRDRVAAREGAVGAGAGTAAAGTGSRGRTATEPIAARDERLAGREEPIAAREERLGTREEPMTTRQEAVAPRDEPMAAREEPVAARDTNGVANGNAAPAAGEPVGTGNGNSVAEPGYGEPAPRRRGGLAGLFGRR